MLNTISPPKRSVYKLVECTKNYSFSLLSLYMSKYHHINYTRKYHKFVAVCIVTSVRKTLHTRTWRNASFNRAPMFKANMNTTIVHSVVNQQCSKPHERGAYMSHVRRFVTRLTWWQLINKSRQTASQQVHNFFLILKGPWLIFCSLNYIKSSNKDSQKGTIKQSNWLCVYMFIQWTDVCKELTLIK